MGNRKPVNCGCGGTPHLDYIVALVYDHEYECDVEEPMYRVFCPVCGISTPCAYPSKTDAVTAWNRAMGNVEKSSTVERTAKVISDDVIITVNGYKYHHDEYLCNACKNRVFSCDSYCSYCGAKLDWSGNEVDTLFRKKA